MDRVTTITSKGQVTIPKAVRDALGLKPHDQIEFWVENGEVFFRKADASVQGSAGGTPSRDISPGERDNVLAGELDQA